MAAIPDNATIAISGEHKPGDALVIESFDGANGAANWRTDAEVNTAAERETAASKPNSHQPWPPPLKPRAPYS